MSNSDKSFWVFMVMVFLALSVMGGCAVGDTVGRNRTSSSHCISIGYDDGTWDGKDEQIVCQTFETLMEEGDTGYE